MIITRLEPYNSRIKVYIDEQLAFLLYKGEIKKLHLQENEEITEEKLNIIYGILYNRAKERALYILDNAYKTEKQIVDKLKSGFYPDIIIDKVMAYLKEYGLVNDARFAALYIDYKSSSKSKKQIVQDLLSKGVSRDLIDLALEKSDFSDESSINKIIEKRINRYDLSDQKSVQKLYMYLIGKGYSYGDIRKSLSKYVEI